MVWSVVGVPHGGLISSLRQCKTALTSASTYSKLKDYVFQSVTQAYSEKAKENPSAPSRSRTYDLPITSSDALLLSYRRLVVAGPLNYGSCDKHPAYC